MKKALILLSVVGMGASYATVNQMPRDSDLAQAVVFARKITSADALSSSLFGHVVPGGGPNDYVQYLFSSMGAREWRSADVGAADLVAGTKNPHLGKQVVLRGIPGSNELVVEAYSDPGDEAPDWQERLKFPAVVPDPKNIARARQLLDRGASFRNN